MGTFCSITEQKENTVVSILIYVTRDCPCIQVKCCAVRDTELCPCWRVPPQTAYYWAAILSWWPLIPFSNLSLVPNNKERESLIPYSPCWNASQGMWDFKEAYESIHCGSLFPFESLTLYGDGTGKAEPKVVLFLWRNSIVGACLFPFDVSISQ